MIKGHQRITCVFVVGCNNIKIRTCEVVVLTDETRIAEIGHTSCSFKAFKSVISKWINHLPLFKTDIIVYDKRDELKFDMLTDVEFYERNELDGDLIQSVYDYAEIGRWGIN
jgi:hypothetical protein